MLFRLLAALAVVLLPAAAFYGGWCVTETVLRSKLIPLPSDPIRLAAGTGCFFWMLSALIFFLEKHRR